MASVTAPACVAIVTNTTWNLSNFRLHLIRDIVASGYRLLLISPDGPERSVLLGIGAVFIPLQHLERKGTNPLRELLLIRELWRIYRREKVDVALHFTIKPVIYGSLAARWADVNNIVTLTGLGYTFLGGRLRRLTTSTLYRLALSRAQVVYFHNPDDRELFISKTIISKSVARVVPGSGIDPGAYPLSDYSRAIVGRFLFVGRLLVDKGIREFVAAARMARALDPHLSFMVVGGIDEGNPAAITAKELSTWIAEGSIDYLGELKDVRPALVDASFVVLPSYREGCPRVLLEAGSTGRPMLGADVAGIRQLVIPGQTGWLFSAQDAAALRDAFLLASRSSFHENKLMGLAARKLVVEHYSVDSVINHYKSAIKEGVEYLRDY